MDNLLTAESFEVSDFLITRCPRGDAQRHYAQFVKAAPAGEAVRP